MADSTSGNPGNQFFHRWSSAEMIAEVEGYSCNICKDDLPEINSVARNLRVINSKVYLICKECVRPVHFQCYLNRAEGDEDLVNVCSLMQMLNKI